MDKEIKNELATRTNVNRLNNRGASRYPKEIGGPKGPEPTRYGDWEKHGRCIDF